jgi:hypothetical protein
MMRLLAFLLLFALNVQTLPSPRWGQQATASFYGSSEEEVHDDCDMEMEEIAQKWSAPRPLRSFQLRFFEGQMHVAIEEATRPSCLYAPEVLTPPPNRC